MIKQKTQKAFSPAKLFAALAAACVFNQAYAEVPAENALPTGGQVTAGQANISQHGTTMNIDQSSQRAVVNWSSFDVGSKATVNFNQPNAQAATLNVVSGASKSMINGAVNANGQVIFVNNNGVVFGKNAEVNVGGMVATTMNVDQKKFMDGDEKLTFTGDGTGKVVNKGHLNVTDLKGYIALMAPEVKNEGVITATLSGENAIALVSGQKVSLTFSGNQLVSVSVDASSINSLIKNKHLIQTNGGQVIIAANAANDLLGSVIKNTGVISATGISKKGGVISLTGDTVKQAGNVAANSDTNEGGKVTISGNNITLASGSNTTATGATQGGTVLVGTTVAKPVLASNSSNAATAPIAKNVTVEAGANVDASATQKGNGGTIAIWSQIKTAIAGNLTAKAGAQNGNGGFIETSSLGQVSVAPTAKIDTSAAHGKAGNWTIDPTELVIDSAAATAISNALANSNVTLDATLGGCAGFGVCTSSVTPKISFNADAHIASSNVQTVLNLIATGGEINFNSVIEAGSINAVADNININAQATLTALAGNNGNILLVGANINILGVINANGSTGNSGSTSNTSAGAASASTRRRTAVDSGLAADLNTYLSNGGNVKLLATGDISIDTNASIIANGLNGGSVSIVSQNGTVNHQGVVDAVGTQNAGGQVTIAGHTATVLNGALISVDGLNTAGTIQLGSANHVDAASVVTNAVMTTPVNQYFAQQFTVTSSATNLDINTGISASAFVSNQNALNQNASNQNSSGGHIDIAGTALNIAATILANADNGGQVTMIATDTVQLQNANVQTNGSNGRGGSIAISGAQQTLLNSATISATGLEQGGKILIGNDAQHGTLPFSVYTSLDALTVINAGQINPNSLAGGFVETSGQTLGLLAAINAGRGGMWLLDPFDITIGATEAGYINTALNAGTNVSISTANSSNTVGSNSISGTSGTGIIFIKSAINATTGSASLTLTASEVQLQADITTRGDQVYNADLLLAKNVTLTSNNGNVTVNGNVTSTTYALEGYIALNGAGAYYYSLSGLTGTATASGVMVGGGLLSYNSTTATYTWVPGLTFTSQYLLVGAGGAGGYDNGGGGGAGAVVAVSSYQVTANTSYTITVGIAGVNGTSGGTSSIVGGGINSSATGGRVAGNGGNFSGGAGGASGYTIIDGVSTTANAGATYSPSLGCCTQQPAGGGGGAAGAGGVGGKTAGGAGVVSSITGTAVTYGVGGTGSANQAQGFSPTGAGSGGGGGSGGFGTGPTGRNGTVIFQGQGFAPDVYTLTINSGTGTATITGNVSNVAGITVNSASNTNRIDGIISGIAFVTKQGTGILTLNGINTYSGNTTISAGTLKAGSNQAFGVVASSMTVASGATLDLNGTNQIVLNPLTASGTGVGTNGAIINSDTSNAATYRGPITLGAMTYIGGPGDLTLSGAITTTTGIVFVNGSYVTATNSANSINAIAGVAPRGLTLTNNRALLVATVNSINGIANATGPITITNLSGGLTVSQAISSSGDVSLNSTSTLAVAAITATANISGDRITLVGNSATGYAVNVSSAISAINGITVTGNGTTAANIVALGVLTQGAYYVPGTNTSPTVISSSAGVAGSVMGKLAIGAALPIINGGSIGIGGIGITITSASLLSSTATTATYIVGFYDGTTYTKMVQVVLTASGGFVYATETAAKYNNTALGSGTGTNALNNTSTNLIQLWNGSTAGGVGTVTTQTLATSPSAGGYAAANLTLAGTGFNRTMSGDITVTANNTAAGSSAGITQTGAITMNVNGGNISFTSNNKITQSGAIAMVANTSGTTTTVSYDTTIGNKTSTITTGALTVAAGSTSAIDYSALAAGGAISSGAVSVPGSITLDNTYGCTGSGCTPASSFIDSANASAYAITSGTYGVQNTGAFSAGTNITLKGVINTSANGSGGVVVSGNLSSSQRLAGYGITINGLNTGQSGAYVTTTSTVQSGTANIAGGDVTVNAVSLATCCSGFYGANNFIVSTYGGDVYIGTAANPIYGGAGINSVLGAITSRKVAGVGGNISLYGTFMGVGPNAINDSSALTADGAITIVGTSTAAVPASAIVSMTGAMTVNVSGGSILVAATSSTGTGYTGAATGLNLTGTITQNASGGNIRFTSNNIINQTGAISLAANTSGTASAVTYDTTSGTKASTIAAGALTITTGSTSAINYVMKSAGSAIDPAAIGTTTVRLPGYVLLDNTFGGLTPATGYYNVSNIATVIPTVSVGVTINNAIYATDDVTVKGIASANQGVAHSAVIDSSAGDISITGITSNNRGVYGTAALTANNITVQGYSSVASSWIVQLAALTINSTAVGGNISVTATGGVAGANNGIYTASAISGASGTNINFISNNNISQTGAITLAANTSGTASTVLYDTTSGTKLSTIASGALTITTGSTSDINLTIKSAGSYLNPAAIGTSTSSLPGAVTIDNTYGCTGTACTPVSGFITASNLATLSTTNYGVLVNNAIYANKTITINAVNNGGTNAMLAQAAMVSDSGDITIVATGTSSYVLANVIQNVQWYTAPLTANNGTISLTGTATTGSGILYGNGSGNMSAKAITIVGTTASGSYGAWIGNMTIVAGGSDIAVTGNVGTPSNNGIYQTGAIAMNAAGGNISFISNGVINQAGAITMVANTSTNASTVLYDTTSGTKASNITAGALTLAAGSTNLVSYVMKSAGSALNPNALNVTGSVTLDNTYGCTGTGCTPATGYVTAANLATLATASPGVKMDNAVTADRGITIKGISNGGYGISFTAAITSTTQAINLTGTSTTSSGVYASTAGSIVALSDQVTIVGVSTTGKAVDLSSPLTGNAISITANGTTATTIASLVAMTVNTVYVAGTNAAPTFISLSTSATNGTYIGTISGTALPNLTAASLAGTSVGTGAAAIQSASVIYLMSGSTSTNANYLIGWGSGTATKLAQLNLQLIGTQVIATTMAAKTSTTALTTGSGTNILTLWNAGTAATAQATSLTTAGIGISNIAFNGTTFTNNSSGNLSVVANNSAAGSAAGISQTGVINVNANGANISFVSNNKISQAGQINLAANTSGTTSNVVYDTTSGNKTSDIVAGILVNTGSTSPVNYLMKASGAAIDPAVTVSGSVVLDNTYGCTGTGCTPVSGYITLANAATLATASAGVTTTGDINAGTFVTLKGISSGNVGVVTGGVVTALAGDVTIDGYSTAAAQRAVSMPSGSGVYAPAGNILVRGTKSVASTVTVMYFQGASTTAPFVFSASGNIDVTAYTPSSSTSAIYSTNAVFVAGGNITVSGASGGTTEATVSLTTSAVKAVGTFTIQGSTLINNVATPVPGAAVSGAGHAINLTAGSLTVPVGKFFEGVYTGIVAGGDVWIAGTSTATGAYHGISSTSSITSTNGSVTLIGVTSGNGGIGVNLTSVAHIYAGTAGGVLYSSSGNLTTPTMITNVGFGTIIGQVSGSVLPTLTGAVIAGASINTGTAGLTASVIKQIASTANTTTYLVGVTENTYVKIVELQLTKVGNNVYASTLLARYATLAAALSDSNIQTYWNAGTAQTVAISKTAGGYGVGNLTFDPVVAISASTVSTGGNINVSGSSTNATTGYGVYSYGSGGSTTPHVYEATGDINVNAYVAGNTAGSAYVFRTDNYTLFKSGGNFTISGSSPNITGTVNWAIYLTNTVMSIGGNFSLQGATLATLTNANGSSAGATIANVATAATAGTVANLGANYGVYFDAAASVTYAGATYSNISVTGNVLIKTQNSGASAQSFQNNTSITAGGTLTIDSTATGNSAYTVFLNTSSRISSTGLMSITGRTSTGTGIVGVYGAATATLTSAGGISVTGLGAVGGTTGNINMTGAIENTGGAGTGITISSTYNTALGNVTNSGADGIRITGGANIAAGTVAGGTITALGTITNTGGIVAISMAQPVSPYTVEGKLGVTTANASMANVRYSVQGGNFTSPSVYVSGNYINYRANVSYTASATVANYSNPYGTAYNETTALNWLRTGSNVTLTIPTLPFGITLASVKAGLVWNSSIGAAAVNANVVQNATVLNAGSIKTADGVNVTISSGTPTYTITKANLTITNVVSTTTYDGVTSYASLVQAAGYSVSGLVTSIGGVATGDAVSAVTQTIKSGATVGSGTAVSGVAQAGDFNAVPSAAVGVGLSNYNITYVGKASTVAKAPLQLTAAADSKVYGDTTTALGLVYDPNVGYAESTDGRGYTITSGRLLGTDAITKVYITSTGYEATAGVANSYTATVYGSPWVEGTGLSNYNVTTLTADFAVTPRPLTITASSQSTTYGTVLNLGTSAVTASGLVNGDTITSVTLKYNNASSVPGTVNAGSYTGAITPSAVIGTSVAVGPNNLSNGDWTTTSTEGFNQTFTRDNYTITYIPGNLTVAPKALSLNLNAQTKVYDATAFATLNNASYNLTGFVNGESATINQTTGTYNSVNVANATTVSTALTASNYVAASGTLLSNYILPTSASGAGTITKATLTITANSEAKFVGQGDPSFTYTYSGLQGADTLATAAGTVTVAANRTTAVTILSANGSSITGVMPAAGSEVAGKTYVGALVPSASALNGNYLLNAVGGDYSIAGAGQLIVKVGDTTVSYGTYSNSTNLATAISSSVHALYCTIGSSCGVNDIQTLTNTSVTSAGTNTATFVAHDALSPQGTIQFSVALDTSVLAVSYSTGGYLNVGAYTMKPSSAVPTSAQVNYLQNDPNYPILYTSGKVTVTPLTLTVANNTTPTKQYDTTNSMTGVVLTATNVLAGDGLSLSGFGTYDAASAGTSVGYTIANIQALGADASNYALASSTISDTNGVITKAPVTISGLAANDKVYNANATATLNGTPTVFGALEAVTISSGTATATFNNMNVADNIAVTANLSGLVLSNPNYEITGVTSPLVADITPARITVTAAKVYDGSLTVANSGLTVVGVAGQTLSFGAATTATLTNPNVNSAGFDSLNNVSLLDGTGLASNYTLVNPILSTVTITPANLTISATDAVKTYNQLSSVVGATTMPAPLLVSGVLYTNAATGFADTLSGGVYAFANANAGVGNKTLQVSGVNVLNGAVGANANYNITYQDNTTSTINPLAVTISGLTAADKVYDGTNTAVISGTPTVNGLLGGDTASVNGTITSGTFSSANAANDIGVSLTFSALTLTNSNYVIVGTTSPLLADITPKPITFTGSASKVYDGTASLSGVSVSTGVGSETLLLSNATANSPNVGSGNFISSGTLVDGTGLASNYILPTTLDATTAPFTITPAPLVVTADNQSMTYGDGSLPTLTATIAGFVNGENASVITGAASLSTTATAYNGTAGSASTAGSYAITASQGTLAATNYSFSYVAGTLTVNRANLTITASDDRKVYGSTTTVAGVTYVNGVATGATTGFTHSGLVNGDTLSTVTLTSLGGSATANVIDGPFTITPSTAAGSTRTTTSNYNITYVPATTGLSVTPLTLTLNSSTVTRAYDGTDALANMTLSTGVGSETIVLTNVSANSANVGSGNYIDAATITSGTGSASNYALPTLNATTAPVSFTPKAISIAGVKTYDATTGFSGVQVTISGLIGSETLNFSGAASNDANVSTANKYFNALTLADGTNGGLATNYALPSLTAASASNTVTINPLTLTLNSSTVTRAYDGTTALPNMTLTTSLGQTVTLSNVTSNSDDVGSGNYISAATLNDPNYALPTLNATTAPVAFTPKAISIAGVKTYDATTGFSGVQVTMSGLIGTETLTYTGAAANDANVATANKYFSAITLADGTNGGLAVNYALPSLTAASADNTVTINPLTLTLNSSTVTRTYDGTDALANMTITTSLGETVTLTNVTADSANVGSGNYIDAATITSGTGAASNYALPTLNATTAPVAFTPKAISIAGVKTYDATTGFSGVQVTMSGLIGTETLTYTGAAANDANVATANKYFSAITLADGTNGGLATNYALPSLNAASAENTVTLTPKAVSIAGVKTYDTTTSFSGLQVTITGLVGSETLNFSGAASNDPNVATANKYFNAFTLADGTNGGLATNYALPTLNATNAPVAFTPKAISIAGVKTYDATTGFSGVQVTITGLIGSETLNFSGAASNDANVATANKYFNAFTLADGTNGGLATNYALPSLTAASASNTVTINPLTLTLNGSTVTRAYDGTTALSDMTLTTSLGQTVTLSNVIADSANVGSGNYISAATLNDPNYALPVLNASTAPVALTPMPITLTAPSITKVYDGGYTYTLSASDLAQMNTQLVGADTVNAATAIFVGSDPNAGTNKAITLSSVTINDGNGGQNYSVTYANSTGTISPKALTITAANDAKFVTQADNPAYAGALYNGFVNGENAGNLVGSLVLTRSDATNNNAGNYTLTASGFGVVSGNYQVTYAPGTYTIVPAGNLLVRATATTTYGTAPTYQYTAQYLDANNNVLSYIGDLSSSPHTSANAINLTATGAATSFNAAVTLNDGISNINLAYGPIGTTLSGSGNINAGQYNLDKSTFTPTGNFLGLTVVGQLTVNPKQITAPTLTANSISKVYDGNAVISGIDTSSASNQLIAGDAAAILASGIYSDKNVASGKSVTVNFGLDGGDAANYVLSATQVTGNYGQITQLASVTYVGPSGGNWSTASNWAGGAIPDYANVANVIIPVNTTVNFDNSVGGPMTSAIQNNGLLNINLNANTTLANTITGTGVLEISNVGTITLTGNNSYTGGTILNAGASLVAGSNSAIGTGGITSNGTANNPASFATGNGVVLPSLSIAGGTTKLMSSITTIGAQSYADLVLGANGTTTLATTNADISLLGKVDSAINKTNSLVIDAGTGNVTIGDSIGSVARFNHLTATGRVIYILADVLTGMTQTYNGSVLIGDASFLGRTPVVGFLFASRSSYFQYQSAGRTSGIEYLNNDPINIRTLITEDPEVTFNGTVNDTVANTHTLLIAAVAPTQPANNASALNAAANINFNQAVGATAPLYSVNLQTILSSSQSGSADVYLGSISMIDSVATYRSQFYRANMMQGQSSTQAAGTVTFSVWDPTATVSYLLPLQTTANSNCTTTCGQMNLQNTGGRQDAIVINGSNNFMSVRNSTGINNWGVRATQNNALGYIAPPRRSGTNFDFDYMRLIQREVKQARENMGNGRELKPVVSVGEAVIEGGTQDCKTRRDDKDIQNLECRLDEI